MVTAQQNLYNLGSAANLTAHELGLDAIAAGDWSNEERVAYTHALANKILTYPESFSDLALSAARQISNQSGNGRLDNYFTAGPDGSASLASAFVNTAYDTSLDAGQKLRNFGGGILNFISGTGNALSNAGAGIEKAGIVGDWLLPVGVVALVAMLVLSAGSRVRSYKYLS